MITPKDLELPDKFSSFRASQFELAAKVAASSKYMYMLDAPTGVGKSLIAATVQRLLSKNILYIATTKQLQDQLLADFPYARTLKGRGNYLCLLYPKMFPTISAEECTNTESNPCKKSGGCPYIKAKREALAAPLAVLNTAYFMTEANFVGTFSGYEFAVIDEFDTVEDMLMGFVEVLITQKQLDELGMQPPKFKTKFESWVEWGREAISILQPRLTSIQTTLEAEKSDPWGQVDFNMMREEKRLSRLVAKLSFFVREVDKNWVWYPAADRWSFKPVWIAKYANGHLWKHMKRVLGMSATILDRGQICRNVGLEPPTTEYKGLPSPFPKEHRPIYYEPWANVINKQMDAALPRLCRGVDSILKKHQEEKILIHCVSYKVMNYLMGSLPDKGRLMTHTTFDRAAVLESFKKSKAPKALLSPSMDRGVDLPQDECRVAIIAKMPFPDLGDPQVNKRVHASGDGDTWYAHKTVSKIIQMSGRHVRSVDDYGATYILDEQFDRIYRDHNSMFPGWWKEAVIL